MGLDLLLVFLAVFPFFRRDGWRSHCVTRSRLR
jgi:hypothetical protein